MFIGRSYSVRMWKQLGDVAKRLIEKLDADRREEDAGRRLGGRGKLPAIPRLREEDERRETHVD